MKPLEWNDSLSLGIEAIDAEHKKLLALSNALIASVKSDDRDTVRKCFHELREYTVVHFLNEEKYMEQIRYPELSRHKLEHLELKSRVKQYQEGLFHRAKIDPKDVQEFIKHWLIDHVVYADMNIKIYRDRKQTEKTD